jgi:hypothetical protein
LIELKKTFQFFCLFVCFFYHREQKKEKQDRDLFTNMFDYRASGLYLGGLNNAGALPLTDSFFLATV